MNQKHLLSTVLVLSLSGIVGASIYVRPTVFKMALGLLGIGTITTATSINSKIDEQLERKHEAKIKRYKATIRELELDIEIKNKEIIELKNNHQIDLDNLRENHRQEIAQLASENHQAFEQKISLINRKHALEIERLKAEQDGELKASDEVIDSLRNEKKTLQGNINTLQKELESLRDELVQNTESLKKGWENLEHSNIQLEREREKFQHEKDIYESRKELSVDQEWEKLRQGQFQLNQERLKFNEVMLRNKAAFDSLRSENDHLKQKLGLSQKMIATNNGRFNTASVEGFLADRIESFFRRNKLPLLYTQSIASTPDRLKLQFSAKEDDKKEILKLEYALSCDVFSGKDISIKREGGYIIIDIPKITGGVEIATVSPDKPNTEYFKQFILNSNHFLIGGATGDGKTVLVSNILELCSTLFTNSPEIIIINPKPSATKFTFKGKEIKPDYLNITQPNGCTTPSCEDGLIKVRDELLNRMRDGQLSNERDETFPDFNPLIILFEECPTLKDEFNEFFSDIFKMLSRLGREYKIIGIGLGQDATVREWGLSTRSQIQNFSRIYLKSILNTQVVHDSEIKYLPNREVLTKQIDEFKGRTGNKKDASSYYGLFIPQGNSEGELCYLPRPNYFIENDNSNSLDCPSCGSSDIIKYGLKHNKQNYQCKDCNTQFTTQNAINHFAGAGIDR